MRSNQQKLVLVVGTSELNREAVKEVADHHGHFVIHVARFGEGLNVCVALREFKPVAVVFDPQQAPDFDDVLPPGDLGPTEFVRRLRQIPKCDQRNVRVVALSTASNDMNEALRLKEIGVDGYVGKVESESERRDFLRPKLYFPPE